MGREIRHMDVIDTVFQSLDDRFRGLDGDYVVERIHTGTRKSEGPVYFPAGRYLVWSDIPNSRLMRWDETTGAVGVFREDSGYANGNTIDRQGRLVTCEQGNRRVTRTEHDGSVTVLADAYQGKRLNSPNDVVVRADGSIWFTDPSYGIDSDHEGNAGESELGGCFVFRLDPTTGELRVVADDFVRPNGLAFSPDESRLLSPTRARSPATSGSSTSVSPGRSAWRDPLHLRQRQVRRPPARRGRPDLGRGLGRRPLLRARWRPDRQAPAARVGREPHVRRPEAQPPVHHRRPLGLRPAGDLLRGALSRLTPRGHGRPRVCPSRLVTPAGGEDRGHVTHRHTTGYAVWSPPSAVRTFRPAGHRA